MVGWSNFPDAMRGPTADTHASGFGHNPLKERELKGRLAAAQERAHALANPSHAKHDHSAASKAGFKYTSSYSLMCMTLALALPLVMFTAFATADNAFMGDEISSAESRMLTSSHDEHVAIHSAPSSPDASSEASNTSAPGSAEGGEAASDAPAGDPSLEASGDQAAERITEREAAAPLGKAEEEEEAASPSAALQAEASNDSPETASTDADPTAAPTTLSATEADLGNSTASFASARRRLLVTSPPCPALFSGSKCSKPVEVPQCIGSAFAGPLTLTRSDLADSQTRKQLGVMGDSSFEAMPKQDFMGPAGRVGSCALVTSGASVLGTGWGKLIDAHDVVVRLNNAPSHSFGADVGFRTDLRYTNGFYEGFREVDSEAVIAGKWCDKGTPCDPADLKRVLAKKAHPLNPDLLMHIKKNPIFKKAGHNPSAGFVAVVLLLHKCSQVKLYGFHVLADKAHGGHNMKQWYYTDSLWHKVFGPNDKHPEEKEMYRFKKWTVNKWTFATSSKVSLRPGTSKVGEASGREGGGKLPDRGLAALRTGSALDSPIIAPSPADAYRANAWKSASLEPVQRRLLQGQSRTILVEKHCLRELHDMDLISSEDISPALR